MYARTVAIDRAPPVARLERMPPVTVLVLSPAPEPGASPLARILADARAALGEHHRAAFAAAGADRVDVRTEPPDDTPFGARLARLVAELRPAGLVVLGAGAIPLATAADARGLVLAASGTEPSALVNHRASADVIAIACAASALARLPASLATDNALPRWLEEVAGVPCRDLRDRRRLAMDIDTPLDLLVLEGSSAPRLPLPSKAEAAAVRERLGQLRAVASDPGAELLVAGRTSSADLRWIERATRSRTRALIEERGLKAGAVGVALGRPNRSPPRSVLGLLLDTEGRAALGRIVAGLSDGALIDIRVLLAHRLGADERGWPSPDDRFASDLLLPERVSDPWLAELTRSALEAPVPVLLGGHGLVGPGVRLVLGARP